MLGSNGISTLDLDDGTLDFTATASQLTIGQGGDVTGNGTVNSAIAGQLPFATIPGGPAAFNVNTYALQVVDTGTIEASGGTLVINGTLFNTEFSQLAGKSAHRR